MAEPTKGRFRFRHPGWITAGGVVAVATVVMAVVAVLEYVRPSDTLGTSDTATTRPVVPDGSSSASQPDPTGEPDPTGRTDPPAATNLADLTLVSGASRLAPLPEELESEAGYERAVVIACASNQTGDQISEVTYETRYLYSTLDAELRPYRDPPDNVLVNLRVFSDPQDRQPGAPPPGEPHLEQLRMGEARTVEGVEIGDSYYLRLRVECEKPSGYLILIGTVLHPAT
jgi:hypothetical protein